VLPPDKLMARAFALAEEIAKKPTSLVRATRMVLTEHLKRQMQELLGFGLYAELLALTDRPDK
jgi:enoyl-CoA hydratase/carnithine racemase